MSKNNIYIGTLNDNSQDHSKHVTVHVPAGTDVSSLVRTFFAEDVTPVQEEKPTAKKPLPFFVPEKLAALGTYTEEEFESKYHEAVQSGAPKLAKFIKHYIELEVFDTKDLNKKDTYEELKAYFGDELDFGYPNFAAYY